MGLSWRKLHKFHKGFTLVELLVVMSIMSMLMSLLLPALSGARQQSYRVHCFTNLRTLTMAWDFYARDYDDKLCSSETCQINADSSIWVADEEMMPGNLIGGTEQAIKDGVLWRYTQSTRLYRCKSQRTELLRGYSIARTMQGNSCGCGSEGLNPFRSLIEIKRAAEKMVFIDSASQAEWIDGSFWPVADLEQNPTWSIRLNHTITARHNGGCNFSFADGHCEYRKWKDSRTVRLTDWKIAPSDASDNNVDLDWMINILKGR